MKLYGKLVKNNIMLKQSKQADMTGEKGFHDTMEELFIILCKELDIPVPIWLKKNTNEISRYRKTFFGREQFIEEVFFDKFILEIEV